MPWGKKRPASEAYHEMRVHIDRLMADIRSQLHKFDREAKRNQIDWGHFGSVAHVAEELRNIAAFLRNEDW